MRDVGYRYKAPRYLSHIDNSFIYRGKKRRKKGYHDKDKDKIKRI